MALAVSAGTAWPGAVHADPPGPTDFGSTVVAVEPAVETIEATIVGGDAFFELRVEPGVTVAVAGYQGEPYLAFDADGTVRENQAAPTFFVSRTRSGSSVPDGVTADDPPEWVVVAGDGVYAWHDHRAHWMGGTPTGARGDVVARGVVPLTVDGVAVDVSVETRWLPGASVLPALVGATAGVGLAAVSIGARRRRRWAGDVVLVVTAAVAAAVGVVQFRSVPAVTAPTPLAWALPGTALVAAAIGSAWARRSATGVLPLGARLLAGVELAIWSIARRSGLTAAILPTDAPFWLDRSVTAAAGVVGAAVAGAAALELAELVSRPAGASATAPRPGRTPPPS